MAGSNITQQRVVQLTNQITNYTAGGLTTVTNWKLAHSTTTYPTCSAFVQVQNGNFVPVLGSGHQVFVCFKKGAKNYHPVAAPAGTPGT